MTSAIRRPEGVTQTSTEPCLDYWWTLTQDMSRGRLHGQYLWDRRLNIYFK